MFKKSLLAVALLPLGACVAAPDGSGDGSAMQEEAAVVRVVPESYVSKAWTVHLRGDAEMRVTFWRPDVFRIEKGLKVADTNVTTATEISASGQFITTTNAAYTVAYADPLNDPEGTQMILPEVREDASRVRFEDGAAEYVWRTTALTLFLNKEKGTFACWLGGQEQQDLKGLTGMGNLENPVNPNESCSSCLSRLVFAEAEPIAIVKAATTNDTDVTTQTLTTRAGDSPAYFGGGQQNGAFVHTGKSIDIVADCNWAEGGHPNPAPWMMARVRKGVYYGILRHTFSPGRYDFGSDSSSQSRREAEEQRAQTELTGLEKDLQDSSRVEREEQEESLHATSRSTRLNPARPNPVNQKENPVDSVFPLSDSASSRLCDKNQTISLSHNEARFDAFYFVGESFNQVLDRYTEFTGRPNFIPVWGLELGDADAWMTRDKDTREPKQNADRTYVETTPDVVARNAERYRAEDMPGGWLLVNDGYGCKYMQLGWVVQALKGLGFQTGLWTEGALDRLAWEVGTAGTRVQKIDVAWSGPAYQHGLNCNATAYDGFIENSDARPFIWTCQGWAGTQRYGVCWTGDQYGNFDLIRYHVPTVTGSGMSGQAYATTDIDGIFGGSNESYVRDLQWKCFTPALYVMNGWSDVNKAPWSYPEPYKSIVRDWLKWKLRLTPYMYALCREAWETGAPIARPLAWNYPDDPTALTDAVNYEMMLGRDLLVAPVFEPMEATGGWYLRGIYLPEGTWYDYNDGRRVKGGRTLAAYPLTLETLPVFVRGGAILPMYPETLYAAQVSKDTLTFDIWPDGSGEATVYEDDGESRAYRDGAWTRQTIRVAAPEADRSGDVRITLEGVTGKGYKGQVFRRAYEFWVHTAARPAQVLVDGEELLAIAATNAAACAAIYRNAPQCWYYDAAEKGGTVRVKLAKRCCKEKVEVVLNVPEGAKVPGADYPAPPPELVARAQEAAKVQTKLIAPMNATDLGQYLDKEYTIEVDGSWKRVSGAVVCSKDTDEAARVTFRLTTDTGAVIFERVGQKGKDAPQICEVNIPEGTKTLTFVTKQAGEVPAVGVWKNLKLVK